MAQKHTSTAKTESMLENSATDTSIAVMATNIVVGRNRWFGVCVDPRRRTRREKSDDVGYGGDTIRGRGFSRCAGRPLVPRKGCSGTP